MPTTPHKREPFILVADSETWKKLEEILEGKEGDMALLLSQLRYKLWRVGQRDSPM